MAPRKRRLSRGEGRDDRLRVARQVRGGGAVDLMVPPIVFDEGDELLKVGHCCVVVVRIAVLQCRQGAIELTQQRACGALWQSQRHKIGAQRLEGGDGIDLFGKERAADVFVGADELGIVESGNQRGSGAG